MATGLGRSNGGGSKTEEGKRRVSLNAAIAPGNPHVAEPAQM